MVLSMQSFKRGMPLLPARADEKALTEINAGRKVGLPRWLRYETTKFKLSEYVPEFFRRLGFELEACDILDGQKLVPYMFLGPKDMLFVAFVEVRGAKRPMGAGPGEVLRGLSLTEDGLSACEWRIWSTQHA